MISKKKLYPDNHIEDWDGVAEPGFLTVNFSQKDETGHKRTLEEVLTLTYHQVAHESLRPVRAVFSGPATILFWPDETKTVVKCQDGEPFDAEKGVALAILKKLHGGGKYNDMLRNLIKHATWDKKD